MEAFWAAAVGIVWGLPLVILLAGAGVWFMLLSRAAPLRHAGHALAILSGRYERRDAPGEISHFRALSAALSGTIGMGNIAGVAIAIAMGGSGAVFWMWVAGALGMATKFFTCTLSCLYRKPDSQGVMQGGPMYYIEVGLGPRFRPLAMLFAACAMVGCLGVFQSNQLAGLMQAQWSVPAPLTGLLAMTAVGYVVLGGSVRVGRFAGPVVPLMCLLYLGGGLLVIADHAERVPAVLRAIVLGAFDVDAGIGGAAGLTVKEILVTGVRRAVFSNEAGLGTEALAHGAAQTDEPVREGLVAMLGPFIDTHLVCTMTALVILTSGVSPQAAGVVTTAQAFEASLPGLGAGLVSAIFAAFALTTMITYAYYSVKCAKYLFGERRGGAFVWIYLVLIPIAALWTPTTTVNIIDTAYALMVIPNMTATLLLAPRVLVAMRDYFARLERR
ncbi:MAG: sodium:alanine symporter family protein [Gammaproteobacteria bacterium]|nr:sodium:alanine symporter family protein [Gammaproteobacteria bacterium]